MFNGLTARQHQPALVQFRLTVSLYQRWQQKIYSTKTPMLSLSQQLTVANFPMFTVQTQASKQNNHHFTTNIVKLAHRNYFTKSAVKIVLFWSLWSWPHHDSSPANQGGLSIQLVNSKPTPDERASVTGWLKSPLLTLCNWGGEFSWPSHWLT